MLNISAASYVQSQEIEKNARERESQNESLLSRSQEFDNDLLEVSKHKQTDHEDR